MFDKIGFEMLFTSHYFIKAKLFFFSLFFETLAIFLLLFDIS